ncbi:MAG: hypothetical protein U0T32_11995 [Chitinophagales bacterium]
MLSESLLKLTKQLYPTGRAFKMSTGSVLEKLHQALNKSEERAYSDAVSILYSILPDNDQFTADDATDWNRRLGMIINPLVPLEDRKLAILRKRQQPGTNPAKEHYLYIQSQLRAAGFDVYVYENRFYDSGSGTYITKTPFEITGNTSIFSKVRHGTIKHGQSTHGVVYNNKIANYLEPYKDSMFLLKTLRGTFFIAGSTVDSFATVPATREKEFRQLILQLKPLQTVGFLFINYI